MHQDSHEQRYSLGTKAILLCIAWGTTIILTFPGVMSVPACFPIGLPWLIAVALGNPQLGRTVEQLTIFIGWLIYMTLSAAALMTTRKAAYVTVYTVLCVLLALNIFGCRLILSDLKSIR